jgi:predicted dehydrogenase
MNRDRASGPGGWVEMDPGFTAKANLILRYTEDGRVVTAPASTVDQFETEIDAFSNAILQDTPNLTPGEEGLRDTRIQMACYESALSGKVVSLIAS